MSSPATPHNDFAAELLDLLRAQNRHQQQLENMLARAKHDTLALVDQSNSINQHMHDTLALIRDSADALDIAQRPMNSRERSDKTADLDALQDAPYLKVSDMLDACYQATGSRLRASVSRDTDGEAMASVEPDVVDSSDDDAHFHSTASTSRSSATSPRTAPLKSDSEDEPIAAH